MQMTLVGIKLLSQQLQSVRRSNAKPATSSNSGLQKAIQYGAKLVDYTHEWKQGDTVLVSTTGSDSKPTLATIQAIVDHGAEYRGLELRVMYNVLRHTKPQTMARVYRSDLFLPPLSST